MRVYRLARPQHINDLKGTGAKLYGGRWNSPGKGVLYCSANSSLCALEVLVHSSRARLQQNFSLASIDLDPALTVLSLTAEALPKNWHHFPHPLATQKIGDQWLREGKQAILKLPSAVNTYDFNYLINPLLLGANQVNLNEPQDFNFDLRLS
jgi:RES domain-containing protein